MALMRVRVAIVTAIGLLMAVVAGGVFDDLVWQLFIAPLVTGLVAVAMVGRPWIWRLAAEVVAVVAAVVVTAYAVGGDVGDAVPGVLRGPRRLLTTEWPSPSEASILVTVAFVLAVACALAADLAGQARLHLAPLAPLVVGLVVLLALGAPLQPPVWAVVGLGLLALALALARPGDLLSRRARVLLGERTLAVSALAVAIAAVGATSVLALGGRANPRRVEDAEVSAALLEPVEAMVALRRADPSFDVFRISDRSQVIGQSLPARWRLAALDSYDGQRWVPRLTLRPIGGRLGIPDVTADRQPPISYEVTFLTDQIDLVPFPGRPLLTDVDVETDLDRVAVRLEERPSTGDTLTTVNAVSEVAPGLTEAQLASFPNRPADEIATQFTDFANNLVGDVDGDLERLQRIEEILRDEWTLDPSAPGGGQQLALISRFVKVTHVGTEEQFVTGFVLLARSLGYDARVATGFVVPVDELSVPLSLNSTHASVWPEVRLDDGGWLAFDPVPIVEDSVDEEQDDQPQAQSPSAAQPPIPPPAEEGAADDDPDELNDGGDSRWDVVRVWSMRVAVTSSVMLLPALLVVGVILLVKWRRRRRRLRSVDPAAQIRGAWANATDSLVDAGLDIGPSWTDVHIARQAAPLAPSVPTEMRRLASMATAMTFGATDAASDLVDDAVLASRSVDEAIRVERSRLERMRWRLSLRSLRRSTRSPVTPGA